MISFYEEKYDKYQKDYNNFTKSENISNYIKNGITIDYSSNKSSIFFYKSHNTKNSNEKKVFLIVPSILNSPEIFFIKDSDGFMENLQKNHDVYIISWLENNFQKTLEDYAKELVKILTFFQNNLSQKLHLIGHCIGGNISIAALQILSNDLIKSLTLLTCPWNFSHFKQIALTHKYLGLDKIISNMEILPQIYLKIMLFLIYPMQFDTKINKYSNLKSKTDKDLFLKIEYWLQSGSAITKSVYTEILEKFCIKNAAKEKKWEVNNQIIDLKKINIPVCIIRAKDDLIAPFESMEELGKEIKNSTFIDVDGGHIKYLTTKNQDFYNRYNNWNMNL